jgi:hypothetical protein
MPIFIPLMCLLGMGVARFRGHAEVVPADPAVRDDVPVRLLGWAVGMLSAQREEWGQAMLGELGHIDGRRRRWRFAAGCASAALLLPPWGRSATMVWAMVAVAAGSAGLYASVGVRYGLEAWGWVFAAIALVLLASYTLVASVLLRQPGVALPGLLGGLFIALTWLAPGYTFYDVIASVTPLWAVLVQVIVVPLLVGVAGALWGGSAAVGRRIARLAAISAGLYIFLYGTIAVAVLGAGGPPGDPNSTVSAIVDDRLGNNAVFYLWFLPLTTAAIAWAAAAATARVHPRPAATVSSTLSSTAASVPLMAAGLTVEGSLSPMASAQQAERPVRVRNWRRTARLALICAGVAAILILTAAGWLISGR